MAKTVELTRQGQVATLTFNRPDKLNAFNRSMARHLEEAVSEVRRDPYLRVLILRGEGEVFMAGSDLQEANDKLKTITPEVNRMIRHFNASIMDLREMDKLVIACVHGLVMGTGMSLMLASDLVIASGDTRFSLGFSRIATSPAGGVSYMLPQIVGTRKAMEWLLFSEMFDVKIAEKWGLVNWVVPESELMTKAMRIADKLVRGPAAAFAQTKQLVNSAPYTKFPHQLRLEANSFVKLSKTRDFKSAVRAFLNKVQPDFEGR